MEETDFVNRRNEIQFLFNKGIESALPKNLFKKYLSLKDDVLTINSINKLREVFNLKNYKNIFITGAGKASTSMAKALEEILEDKISGGIVATKYGFTQELKKIKQIEAAHPVPDKNSVKAANNILDFINAAGEKDLVINLISGGASALLTLPVDEVSLDDKIDTTEVLLNNEASITEINTIRKCLSKVKGGGLVKDTKAEVISLIISDVIGDDINFIASGPTVNSSPKYSEALQIIYKYKLENKIPKNVLIFLKSKKDNLKTEEKDKTVNNFLIGNNDVVIEEIIKIAESKKYSTVKINEKISGEVRESAKEYYNKICSFEKSKRPLCIVSGGETTVNIIGNGKGGRNQEFCLALAEYIKDKNNIVILSGGTDGNDGPTDAAGAIIDSSIIQKSKEQNIDITKYLSNNDSYYFFQKVNSLLKTGPTLTNVMDIQITLLF